MRRLSGLTCFLAFAAANTASASDLRFRETAAGNVVATGNTLGLSKGEDENGPGTADSIGTFLSLDNLSVDDSPANPGNPWGGGTTGDWTMNGSDAELVLPGDNTTVLYAELIWGGSTAYGSENVTAELETPVTLAFGDDSITVAPDPVTALTLSVPSGTGSFVANYYMRSADVTDFVAEHGAGFYATLGVPATQGVLIDETNAAGWTLVVAYRTAGEQIRNLTIFVGGSFVDEEATEDYAFEGFCTPPQGDFGGYVVVSAMEGDADRDGDSFAIAQTDMDAFVTLEGPNNPQDNFFCSQINDSDGNVDTAGTAGDANHDADPMNPQNVVGGRQGWDITRVPVSAAQNHLVNGQTEAVIRTQTADDSYVPTVVAFGIEVNAPNFSEASAAAEPELLALEQTSTIIVDMQNAGLVDATGLVFQVELPDGLTLDSFAIDGADGDIDGNPVDDAGLATGVNVGTVTVDQARELELVVRATSAPAEGSWELTPQWTYDYVSCAGDPPLTEPLVLPDIVIDFSDEPVETSSGGVGDSSSGDGGDSTSESDSDTMVDTLSASDTQGDSTSGENDSDTEGFSGSIGRGADDGDSGCGCQSSGDEEPLWALSLFGLVALMRRRRS